MRIPVCYELTEDVLAKAFDGPLWLRGQAIVEEVGSQGWQSQAAVPIEAGAPGTVAIDALHDLMEQVRQHVRALALAAADQGAFERALGEYFATVDTDLHDEWLRLADVIDPETTNLAGFPVDLSLPARPDFKLGSKAPMKAPRFYVFVPGELSRRRQGHEDRAGDAGHRLKSADKVAKVPSTPEVPQPGG